MQHSKIYTTGNNHITIFTYHSAIAHLSNKCLADIENPRIVWLLEKIIHFNYSVVYLKGAENKIADCLSRYQISDMEEDKPGMADITRNYTFRRQINRITTRSTKVSVPLDIQHIAEQGQECEDYKRL